MTSKIMESGLHVGTFHKSPPHKHYWLLQYSDNKIDLAVTESPTIDANNFPQRDGKLLTSIRKVFLSEFLDLIKWLQEHSESQTENFRFQDLSLKERVIEIKFKDWI